MGRSLALGCGRCTDLPIAIPQRSDAICGDIPGWNQFLDRDSFFAECPDNHYLSPPLGFVQFELESASSQL